MDPAITPHELAPVTGQVIDDDLVAGSEDERRASSTFMANQITSE